MLYNVFSWETVADKAPDKEMYLADVPGFSKEEFIALSHGFTATFTS